VVRPYAQGVRVATFNVLHGLVPQDGVVDVPRLCRVVAQLDPDVLGLQEVDRAQPRSAGLDLTAEAAAALGGAAYRFAPALIGTPGETCRPARADDAARGTEPAYGIGLVTRLPVRRWLAFWLPAAPVPAVLPLPGPPGRRSRLVVIRDEQRAVLAAVLDGPAGPFTVATTHLSFVPGWNVLQLRRVARALRRLPAPRLLIGDLNLPGPVPPLVTGWRRLAVRHTYPAWSPRLQIDHVLGSGPVPPVAAVAAPAVDVSDHRPLVVDLAVTGGRAREVGIVAVPRG
jgi:endonuclease/exonuclease/phosphatase family metal-dependent hydrolase